MSEFYMIFAAILGEEVKEVNRVDNYTLANQIAKAVYGKDALAVQCNDYKVQAGYYYKDGVFFKEDKVTPCEQNITLSECRTYMQNEQAKIAASLDYISMETGIDLNE